MGKPGEISGSVPEKIGFLSRRARRELLGLSSASEAGRHFYGRRLYRLLPSPSLSASLATTNQIRTTGDGVSDLLAAAAADDDDDEK